MVHVFTRNITRITYLLPLTFLWALLIPLTVMADPQTLSCTDARLQIEQTQNTLQPLEQQQQQLQQHVRTIYQALFACLTDATLTLAQQEHCIQLQEEGPKQFRTMVEAITLSHQTSQKLARQTRQFQLACPANAAEDTFPKKTSLSPLQEIARNK